MAQRVLTCRLVRPGNGLVALVLLAGVAFALPARADAPHPKLHDQYKHQVEKLEEVWRTAQLNADVDAMDKLLSDDYVGITMTGQVVTKTQQLDRMRNRSLVLTKIELTDVKIKVIGTTAIVQSLADVDGTNDGEPMHGTYRYTRVYSRLPSGTWKITNFEATRVGPPPEPRDRRRQPADQRPLDQKPPS
ncbi:MAG: nuclear transport factor 2 family protein [Acidobacteriaceae bacterium]|jgi:ketosteroid isomerase-like protein